MDAPPVERPGGGGAWLSAAAPPQLLAQAVQHGVRHVTSSLESSLEHIMLNGTADEDMESWDDARLCGTLLVLGLLQRRPDAQWLSRFWRASEPRLQAGSCGAEQLSMLSYGLSELQLTPPAAWVQALLAGVLHTAQRGVNGATAPQAARGAGVGGSWFGGGAAVPDTQAMLLAVTSSGSSAPTADVGVGGRLQRLLTGAVRGWQDGRSTPELVTVLHNLSSLGVPLSRTWLGQFQEAMQPRLQHLGAEDLQCLLGCLAEQGAAPGRPWLAACYTRMDQINWVLQGRHLIGCLASLAQLGVTPPLPWLQRRLQQLRPALSLLPLPAVVELAMLLPAMQLPAGEEWLQEWAVEYARIARQRSSQMDGTSLLHVVVSLDALGCGAATPSGCRLQLVAEVSERVLTAGPQQLAGLWQVLAHVESDDLLALRGQVADCLRLTRHRMTAGDVAPTLAALAASGRAPPGFVLDALLEPSLELLPLCDCEDDLVTMALSLLQLNHRPNHAWQAAFFSASRRRLDRMSAPRLASLLVACASLGLHPPELWMREHCLLACRRMQELSGLQLANLAWAVSCLLPDPGVPWTVSFEVASTPRLKELGPNTLAVAIKALSTLHHRPSQAWQAAFYSALEARLFASGAALVSFQDDQQQENDVGMGVGSADAQRRWQQQGLSLLEGRALVAELYASSTAAVLPAGAAAAAEAAVSALTPPSSTSPAASSVALPPSYPPAAAFAAGSASPASAGPGSAAAAAAAASCSVLSPHVTPDALNSLVYSLASLELAPPPALMDELMDAVRCKMSLMTTLDLSVMLAFLVSRGHSPREEWWDDFLGALESRFSALSSSELCSTLVMLNALRVSPSAAWLDAFCGATEQRLHFFEPNHLLQVLSCLHLFRHRPAQQWMVAYAGVVEGGLHRFSPTELARMLMLLDHLNQRPSAAFMTRFFDASRGGLAQLEAQELVNVAWATVSCSVLVPDYRWVECLVAAARPRLATMQPQQLRVFVSALGQMLRGVPCPEAENCLAFAREFLV